MGRAQCRHPSTGMCCTLEHPVHPGDCTTVQQDAYSCLLLCCTVRFCYFMRRNREGESSTSPDPVQTRSRPGPGPRPQARVVAAKPQARWLLQPRHEQGTCFLQALLASTAQAREHGKGAARSRHITRTQGGSGSTHPQGPGAPGGRGRPWGPWPQPRGEVRERGGGGGGMQ